MSVTRKLSGILVLGLTLAACGDGLVEPVAMLGAGEAAFARGGAAKVDVCHRPPSNPDNVRLISISESALADHMAHGDHASFDGACYVLDIHPTGVDVLTADQACADGFGGRLASVHSQAENDFISDLVEAASSVVITPWLGGYETAGFTAGANASYTWIDGSPWDYQSWRGGEPNSTGAPAGIQFWSNNSPYPGWNDVPAGPATLHSGVCKYFPS